jgi:hypothetical protein
MRGHQLSAKLLVATLATMLLGASNARADSSTAPIGAVEVIGEHFAGSANSELGTVVIEHSGRTLVVAGASCDHPGPEFRDDICLVAYDAETLEVADFGIGGEVIDGPDEIATYLIVNTMAADPLGRLVVGVYCERHEGVIKYDYDVDDICLRRFLPDGSVDESFGNTPDHVANAPMIRYQNPSDIAFDDDGNIVVSGYCSSSPCLVGFTPDGDLNTAFGDGEYEVGGSWIDIFDDGMFNALQIHDGKIYAVGTCTPANTDAPNACLARWNLDGTPDNTFQTIGVVTTGESDLEVDVALGEGLLITDDGRIFVGAMCGGPYYDTDSSTCVVEFNDNGDAVQVFTVRALERVSDLVMVNDQLAVVGYWWGDSGARTVAIQFIDDEVPDNVSPWVLSGSALGEFSYPTAVVIGDFVWTSHLCPGRSLCVERIRYAASPPPTTVPPTTTEAAESEVSADDNSATDADASATPSTEPTATTETTLSISGEPSSTGSSGSSTGIVVIVVLVVVIGAGVGIAVARRRQPLA